MVASDFGDSECEASGSAGKQWLPLINVHATTVQPFMAKVFPLFKVATLKRGKLPATLHNRIQGGSEKHHNKFKMLTQP